MDIETNMIERIRAELCLHMARSVVDAWFADASVVSFDGGTLFICSPADFKRDIIISRYIPALTAAARNVIGREVEVRVVPRPETAGDPLPAANGRASGFGERREFVFETFVVGESNKFAYSASRAVADSPGTAYNPLFLYGGSGLGKTHLLYAIKQRIGQSRPDFRVQAFSAEQFTNELVTAIQTKRQAEFREKYRVGDALLVDDIQFIARSDFSQQEFFHTFNTLYDEGRQIVITSDRPPRELQFLEERLRTRFEWGLIVDINQPDFETRKAIVQQKAQGAGLILPADVSEFIAQMITANVRQLEGMVKKLLASRDLMGKPINLETAQEAITDLMRENPGLNPTPGLILGEICNFFHLDEVQVTGKSRQAELVQARQVAMYLIRTMTDLSLENIGEKIFSRDHSTVMHAIKRVEEQRERNAAFDNDIKTLIENIRGV